MFVDFETLANSSRVWIYQSNRKFNDKELEIIKKRLLDFVNSWKRHGDDLKASFTIKYNQFIILAVDEETNTISGCSIDASIYLIKQIESDFKVSLVDKLSIAYKGFQCIDVVKIDEFKELLQQEKINQNTIVFNNMIYSIKELNKNWEIPIEKSWHSRYLV